MATAAIPSGAGKLTAFTAKYQILNKYDPRSPAFQTKWNDQITGLTSSAIQQLRDTDAVIALLDKDSNYKALVSTTDPNLYKMAGAI